MNQPTDSITYVGMTAPVRSEIVTIIPGEDDPLGSPSSPLGFSSSPMLPPPKPTAPRGYHLFQNGPIKLLQGALACEIPRRPGSRCSLAHLVTPKFSPRGDTNVRISMAPSSLLASRVTDFRKWVLAVQPPIGEDSEPFEDEFTNIASLLRAETPDEAVNKSTQANSVVPLEDQITVQHLQAIMQAFVALRADDFFSATEDSPIPKTDAKGPDQRFSESEPKYNRKLTTEEFVIAVQDVIPTATRSSILELANKVDYEGVGVITWAELSTFLVSQTSHRTFLSKARAEFMHVPEPLNCFMDNMHQLVSCYCVDETRKLIVLGGQEGTVRAWTSTTLSYRGILFSTDSWITGVHFSTSARLLYVTTMDKEIFLLDGSNFEVLRVYRGRPVEDNTNSLVYAHDTTRNITVGGVNLPSRKALARQLADAAKLNERRKQDFASGPETITSASACEALNFDSMPLTGQGNGPYVERLMEECVLAGLVDPVTCSAYNYSSLDEEVILLATSRGDIYFYIIQARSNKKVLLSHHILRVHSDRINKMVFFYAMNALVSCADDGKVVVTSMVNGHPIRTFQSFHQHHHVAVRDFCIHPYYRMIVTTGPERYGLVWEFSQENPVAVLEAHNSPCRCCTFSIRNSQVITVGVDGSIFVFDLNGFHRSQKIEPGFAYSPVLITCSSTGSMLCFRRYPYHLRIRRHKTSSCPEKYRGHSASMLTILYTKTFDQIVTVDTEFTVMTWARKSGTNVFTFLLNGYSDSSTLNSAHLTCAALDVSQRRLLTGYQSGVVVVWNIVNGQAINFITAGMEENQTPSTNRPNSKREKRPTSSPRDDGAGMNGGLRPVRTVGSLVRHGSTFFLFSINETLYIVRESSNYTVATASSWKVPQGYGEITSLVQVTPQVVTCGTSVGALFFFHVLSEKQDGTVHWLPEAAVLANFLAESTVTAPAISGRYSAKHTNSSISGLQQMLNPSTPKQSNNNTKTGNYLSRVTQMTLLPSISSNILMTVHADSTVAFWHTYRHVFLGSLVLASAGADEGKDRSGNIIVSVNDAAGLLIFGDEGGSIHVCNFHMEALCSEADEKAALALTNPMMFFKLKADTSTFKVTELKATVTEHHSVGVTEEDVTMQEQSDIVTTREQSSILRKQSTAVPDGSTLLSPTSPKEPSGEETNRLSRLQQERSIHLLDKFERVNVFGTNIRSISSLIIANIPNAKRGDDTNSLASEEPIIICTGADSYARAFTLDGFPIGELGMDPWELGERETYRFLGEPYDESFKLNTSFTKEGGWFYDYLHEMLQTARQMSSNGQRKLRRSLQHSVTNIGPEVTARSFLSKTSLGRESRGESLSPSVGEGIAQEIEEHIANWKQRNTNDPAAADTTTAGVNPEQLPSLPPIPPGFHHHPGKVMDTMIRRGLRQRILVEDEPFKGVLKRRFLRDIRPPNQVISDDRCPTPPITMTPAEEGFLGVIENALAEDHELKISAVRSVDFPMGRSGYNSPEHYHVMGSSPSPHGDGEGTERSTTPTTILGGESSNEPHTGVVDIPPVPTAAIILDNEQPHAMAREERSSPSFHIAKEETATFQRVCRENRARRPKYVTEGVSAEPPSSAGKSSDDDLDPNELIQSHLMARRQQILNSGCTDNSRRLIEHEMNALSGEKRGKENLGGLAMMSAHVDNIVDHHKKERGPAAMSGALSFIAEISSRMYVPPIQEIEAPVGSKSRDEVRAWRDHLSRLEKNAAGRQRM